MSWTFRVPAGTLAETSLKIWLWLTCIVKSLVLVYMTVPHKLTCKFLHHFHSLCSITWLYPDWTCTWLWLYNLPSLLDITWFYPLTGPVHDCGCTISPPCWTLHDFTSWLDLYMTVAVQSPLSVEHDMILTPDWTCTWLWLYNLPSLLKITWFYPLTGPVHDCGCTISPPCWTLHDFTPWLDLYIPVPSPLPVQHYRHNWVVNNDVTLVPMLGTHLTTGWMGGPCTNASDVVWTSNLRLPVSCSTNWAIRVSDLGLLRYTTVPHFILDQ